jgi:hypothetical protein
MRRRVGAALAIVAVCGVVFVIARGREQDELPATDCEPAALRASASRPRLSARSPRSRGTDGSVGARGHAEPPPPESEPATPTVVPDDREQEVAREREAMKRVGPHMFEVVDELIREKAREQIVGSPPTAGTLAIARNWCNKEMVRLLWDREAHDLQLQSDQLKAGWEGRSKTEPRTSSYGTGSFIVAKKRQPHATPTAADSEAEERWWAAASEGEKAEFLTALFVETSGYFEVLRITVGPCRVCGGRGSAATDTEGVSPRCAVCNDAGGAKYVSYR